MNNAQKAATAILAARNSNRPLYCWVSPDWLDGDDRTEDEQITDMQKQYPLNEIISICWGCEEPTA